MFVESAAREADPKGQADAAAVGLQTIHLSEQHSVDALANGIVISPMGPLGRFHPSLAIQPREIDSMTSPLRELLQVLELDTAITFAKWMDEIHITQNWPDPVGHCSGLVSWKYAFAAIRRWTSAIPVSMNRLGWN